MGLYLPKAETQKISNAGKFQDFTYASTSV